MADTPSGWLLPKPSGGRAALPDLGAVLREYRAANQLTQQELADLLALNQTYISMIERGRRQITDANFLLRVALLLGLPPSDLGLSDALLAGTGDPDHGLTGAALAVWSDQSDWKAVRRYLNQHRSALAGLAVGLYPKEWRIRRTTLIAPPSWLPRRARRSGPGHDDVGAGGAGGAGHWG
jgi:transcriptional regulator with XRE-family HTH domain